jgi:uncharacterized protein YabN with tetrapyrrole methylase and pyrophosphatase domain
VGILNSKGFKMKSLLDELTQQTSVLQQAVAIQAQVAKIGFDWPHLQDVIDKLHEEINELKVEIAARDKNKMLDEFGDILFVCANIARWLDIDPEVALAHANQKFEQRFRIVEEHLQRKYADLSECGFMEMLDAWEMAKKLLNENT